MSINNKVLMNLQSQLTNPDGSPMDTRYVQSDPIDGIIYNGIGCIVALWFIFLAVLLLVAITKSLQSRKGQAPKYWVFVAITALIMLIMTCGGVAWMVYASAAAV